jgi:tRNA uridine 5-carboxymethylaminomethyl modification enzyme
LFLRQDNADIRLFEYGKKYNLLTTEVIKKIDHKINTIKELKKIVQRTKIKPKDFNRIFAKTSSKINQQHKLETLIKRPEVSLKKLLKKINKTSFVEEAVQEVEYNIKYEGYLKRNLELIKKFKEQEERNLPQKIDYQSISALSLEARDKLNLIQPNNLGQASRISGVSPADINVLMIYLEKEKYNSKVPRETKQNN